MRQARRPRSFRLKRDTTRNRACLTTRKRALITAPRRMGRRRSHSCTMQRMGAGHHGADKMTQKKPGSFPRLFCVRKLLSRLLLGIEKALKMAQAGRVTKLAQRLRLDLADTFASHLVLLADLFERALVTIHQAETHLDDTPLA